MKYSDQFQQQTAEERLGQRLAARLDESVQALPHDITERLRISRIQALARYSAQLQEQTSMPAMSNGGTAIFGMGGPGRAFGPWRFAASLLPLIALIAGLITLNLVIGDERTRELADIDTAILTDDLPPAAYADPGFAQFLKSAPRD